MKINWQMFELSSRQLNILSDLSHIFFKQVQSFSDMKARICETLRVFWDILEMPSQMSFAMCLQLLHSNTDSRLYVE